MYGSIIIVKKMETHAGAYGSSGNAVIEGNTLIPNAYQGAESYAYQDK